jgi:Sulfotransferase domain
MVKQNESGTAQSIAGRLPDFMIIGAAKSGTTTLYRYLCRHPRVFMCSPKEPTYFSHDEVYARGEAWYRSIFADADENMICGEGSTTYTRWPHTGDASERISKVFDTMKFIYIMRHPVDRAYSLYAHRMRTGITKTFEDVLQESNEYVDIGMYMMQIKRYLRYYPRSCFHFLLQEDLWHNPADVMSGIQQFLGIEELDLTSEGQIQANKGGVDHYIRNRTTQRLRSIPGVSPLANVLPKSLKDKAFAMIRNSFLGKKLSREFKLQPMLDETRQHLLQLYEEPNQELAEFLERDLSAWSK